MKAYIAGRITGNEGYKEDFRRGVSFLEKEGFVVLNPAELPEGLTAQDYMMVCFQMLFAADVAAFLPGWEESRGARLENDLCQYIGKTTMYLESMTGFTGEAADEEERGIKPNDIVLHIPSGEKWMVCGVNEERGELIPCGYPFPSIAKIKDCILQVKAYEMEPQTPREINALLAEGLTSFIDRRSAELHGMI